jgi:hypothetical protein
MNQKTRRRKIDRKSRKTSQKSRKNQLFIDGGFNFKQYFLPFLIGISQLAASESRKETSNIVATSQRQRQTARSIGTTGLSKHQPVSDKVSRLTQSVFEPSEDIEELSFHSAQSSQKEEEFHSALSTLSPKKQERELSIFGKSLRVLKALYDVVRSHELSSQNQEIVDSITSINDEHIVWKHRKSKYYPTITSRGGISFIKTELLTLQDKAIFRLSSNDQTIILSIIDTLNNIDYFTKALTNNALLDFFRKTIGNMKDLTRYQESNNRPEYDELLSKNIVLAFFFNKQSITFDNYDKGKVTFFRRIIIAIEKFLFEYTKQQEKAAKKQLVLKENVGILSKSKYDTMQTIKRQQTELIGEIAADASAQ